MLHTESKISLKPRTLTLFVAIAALMLGASCGVKKEPSALWPEKDKELEEGWNPETLFDREQKRKPKSRQNESVGPGGGQQ